MPWLLAACDAGNGANVSASDSNTAASGRPDGHAPAAKGPHDSGTEGDASGARRPSGADAGTSAVADNEAGNAPGGDDSGPGDIGEPVSDGGGTPLSDGASAPADASSAGDAGVRDVGSCCSAQTTPGCSDPDVELCVCEKDPNCCMNAWDIACALIVQQKYCQTNVRSCVCGADAGQWDQTSCCSSDWTSTCDTVATLKCHAVQGCF